MRALLSTLLSGVACLHLAGAASAQTLPPVPAEQTEVQPAILVADSVFITPERQLIAEGNVEAFQGDIRLQAQKITFDRQSGQLSIEGPIRIDQGGQATVLADAAQLDKTLQDGLLTGARMVFDQQLQLAALQMTRVGGRYTQLYKTSVTSCHVCENGKPPLWQIRAQKVVHDQLEQQLYFEGAQFRVLDVPVFYFPAMRLPDPNLKRATGFLIPSIRTTSQLGTGIKVPYFFRLGDHRDLTVTPYVSSKTNTLNLRYRQAFARGRIEIEGAYTRDDLIQGEDRGYVFATGQFDLRDDYKLNLDFRTVSDNGYLADYGLPEYDRLRSEISIERFRRDSAFRIGLIHYETLRDSEIEDEIPTEIFDINAERRYFPTALGGEVRLAFDGHAHQRKSSADVIGRDIARATLDAEWLRSWTFTNGLRADWKMGVAVDDYRVWDDSNYASGTLRSAPRAALTLRYPMVYRGATGTHYLEPIAQLGWSDVSGAPLPNGESNFVEFDQGNLLALSRFPANDQREEGKRAVFGLNWARFSTSGWQAFATIGQVFRSTSDPRFSKSSGLGGTASDLLLAGQITLPQGLGLTARGLLDGSLNFSKVEVHGSWTDTRTSVSGSYLWLGRDLAENRALAVSEFWFDGSYKVNPFWTASANIRYDIEDSRATRAGIGFAYQNECVTVNISVNRRYTSSTSVEPSTDFGFTIALSGFAVESANKEYRRSCSKT